MMRYSGVRQKMRALIAVALLAVGIAQATPAQAASHARQAASTTTVSLCPALGCHAGNVTPSQLRPFFVGDVKAAYQTRTAGGVVQVRFPAFTIRRPLGRGETTASVSVNGRGVAGIVLTDNTSRYQGMVALEPPAWRNLPLTVHLVISQTHQGRTDVLVRDTVFKS